jgi:hypothetical protein
MNTKKFYYGKLREAVIEQLVIEQVVAGMDISGGTMIPEAWINEAEMIKREVLSAMRRSLPRPAPCCRKESQTAYNNRLTPVDQQAPNSSQSLCFRNSLPFILTSCFAKENELASFEGVTNHLRRFE